MRLELHPAAVDELENAVIWHEHERPGYGRLLYDEIRRRVAVAAHVPKSGNPIAGFAPFYDVRGFLLRRFPYQVITAVIGGGRVVVAIAHTSRAPSYWRKRLR